MMDNLLNQINEQNQSKKLEELRNLPEKELKYVGISYLDKMNSRLCSLTECKRKNDSKKDRTILLAPSWGDNGILKKYLLCVICSMDVHR